MYELHHLVYFTASVCKSFPFLKQHLKFSLSTFYSSLKRFISLSANRRTCHLRDVVEIRTKSSGQDGSHSQESPPQTALFQRPFEEFDTPKLVTFVNFRDPVSATNTHACTQIKTALQFEQNPHTEEKFKKLFFWREFAWVNLYAVSNLK